MLMSAVNIIQVTSITILIYLLYKYFFGFDKRKSKIAYYIITVFTTVVSAVLPFIFGINEDADVLKEIIIMFAAIISPCILFKHRKKLLIPILGLMINATLDYVIFIFTSSLKVDSYYIIGIMYCVLYISLCLLCLAFKNKFYHTTTQAFFESVSPVFYAVIILADLSAYYDVIIKTDATYYEDVSNIIRLFSTVLMVGAVIYIAIKFSKSLHKEKESELQVEMQLKLYNEMVKKNRDIRVFRHDYKNNLFSLETFIKNGKYDDAQKYIEDLNGMLETTKNRFATGNYLADAILSDKADLAGSKNIKIDFSGSIPQNGISNSDLCAILANSLDNAIRGYEGISPSKIIVNSQENSQGIIIKIKNPVAQKVEIRDNKIKTTKSDIENHGFGLNNIKKTAEKYGGYIELSCDERFFEIEIGLYL